MVFTDEIYVCLGQELFLSNSKARQNQQASDFLKDFLGQAGQGKDGTQGQICSTSLQQ